MADGSVVLQVDMDEREATAKLKSLRTKILNLQTKSDVKINLRDNALKQLSELGTQLDVEKAKLENMRPDLNTASEMREQEALVAQLQKEFDALDKTAQRYQTDIENINVEISTTRSQMEAIQSSMSGVEVNTQSAADAEIQGATNANIWSNAISGLEKRSEKFFSKLSTRLKKIFIYSVVFGALVKLKNYIGDVMKSNEAASAALNNLKVALFTVATPVLNVLIPVFTKLLNVITAIVTAIGKLFAMLSGKSYADTKKAAEAMKNEADAIGEAGGAAKDASKSMANFDEINQLSDSSGGGGGGSNESLDWSSDMDEGRLRRILDIVTLIGSAFATWKIASALGLGLGQALGLLLAIYSAVQFVIDICDAWANGLNNSNLTRIFLELLGVVLGLYVALGPTAAAIGLIVGSIALLVTGFRDASKNGFNLYNTMAILAGLIDTGLGIGILTGSWIPLLILGIAGVLIAIASLTGHGGELIEGLKKIFKGFLTFIKGVFSGDMSAAMDGLKVMWEGLKESAKAVWDGIKDIFESSKEWVATTFKSGWEKAWDGVKDVFKGVWNGIISLLESALNWIVDGLNRISFTVPDWVPDIGGKSFGFNIPRASLPRLATGAVIPPNSEFMAVLGDQKSGVNIETPLDTMIEAFNTALRNNGGYGSKEIVLKVDKYELGRAIVDLGGAEQRRIGLSF